MVEKYLTQITHDTNGKVCNLINLHKLTPTFLDHCTTLGGKSNILFYKESTRVISCMSAMLHQLVSAGAASSKNNLIFSCTHCKYMYTLLIYFGFCFPADCIYII